MKAYLLTRSGKPEVLKIHDVDEPQPDSQEVKVRISTIGLNYAEILSRRGQYSWAPKKPYTPGMEAYGEVVDKGAAVTSVKVGDKVIVGNQYGAYAEFICVPEHLVFAANEALSPEENAALVVNFMTAWVALKKQARLTVGESVLIQAAAGGVGTAAVQIAKAMGTKVYGTASRPEKLELIRGLGADVAINYANEDFSQIIKNEEGGIDCVLEVVGGEVFKKSVGLLKPFGRLVVIGFASISFKRGNPYTWWKTWRDAPKVNVMNMAQGSYGISASHIGYLTALPEVAKEAYAEMKEFINEHDIRPHVGRVFDFEDMPDAHRFMESRESMGKIVVKLNNIK